MRQKPVSINSKRRIQIILVIASLAFAGLFGRLAWIQLYKGAEYENLAFEHRYNQVTLDAMRGFIYDAKGRPLAISVMTDTVIANPIEVFKSGKVDQISAQLAEILEMDKEALRKKFSDNEKRWFMYVKRKVQEDKAKAIRALKLPGISFQDEAMRVYPKGPLLANFLGFVGTDNNGLSGLEISYDSILSGTPGRLMLEQDTRGRNIPATVQKLIPSQDGASIVLTIDETVQYILEREIAAAVEKYRPEKMGILAMEPKTGRILGMAQYPTFDPNHFNEYGQQDWRNILVSDVYEPGSTFKTVVMAGAIEEGIVSLNDQFTCSGTIKLTAGTMQCWRGLPHGRQTFVEGVQNSCNPMFIDIGLKMGRDTFYKYLNGFGFGRKTGIDLAGEAAGILVPQRTCRELDLASMSIGQSNAVTPLQLLNAFCAIANGGSLMKPQIVKEIQDSEGNVLQEIAPEVIRQVISQATSDRVMGVLETVVSSGTGKTAYIEGYRVGGKTGTAQKVISGKGYAEHESIVSFMGVAPVNDPQVACLVMMDNPHADSVTGGATCGPIYQAAMQDVLSYLQVPIQVEPQRVNAPSLDEITLLDLTEMPVPLAENLAASQGMAVSVVGTGSQVYAQLPLANTRMMRGGGVVLYTNKPDTEMQGKRTTTPDLAGMTAAEARTAAKAWDLQFESRGSGVVVSQQPAPGTMVFPGTLVTASLEEPVTGGMQELAGP
ncbi:MAG: penicillin-binding transpeptidase domain-containing protein [Clostridiales bacterium]|nr:penicillin-binding transpeptidase domain-containing protein [Clostridiales bacterium]